MEQKVDAIVTPYFNNGQDSQGISTSLVSSALRYGRLSVSGQETRPVVKLHMSLGWFNPTDPARTIAQGKEPELW